MSKTFANMVGHMAYDTQVFGWAQLRGSHIKKLSLPSGVVTS